MLVKVGIIQKTHIQFNELLDTRVIYVLNEKLVIKINISGQMIMFA